MNVHMPAFLFMVHTRAFECVCFVSVPVFMCSSVHFLSAVDMKLIPIPMNYYYDNAAEQNIVLPSSIIMVDIYDIVFNLYYDLLVGEEVYRVGDKYA